MLIWNSISPMNKKKKGYKKMLAITINYRYNFFPSLLYAHPSTWYYFMFIKASWQPGGRYNAYLLGLRLRTAIDEFRAKDFIPDLGSDAKALLVVGEVVLEVVFLEFLVV